MGTSRRWGISEREDGEMERPWKDSSALRDTGNPEGHVCEGRLQLVGDLTKVAWEGWVLCLQCPSIL